MTQDELDLFKTLKQISADAKGTKHTITYFWEENGEVYEECLQDNNLRKTKHKQTQIKERKTMDILSELFGKLDDLQGLMHALTKEIKPLQRDFSKFRECGQLMEQFNCVPSDSFKQCMGQTYDKLQHKKTLLAEYKTQAYRLQITLDTLAELES